MHRMTRFLVVGLLAVVLMTGGIAAAQEASSAIVLPLAPDPARCATVTPMSKAEVDAIYAEVNPEGIEMEDPEGAVPEGIETGEAVDEATQAAITEAIVIVLACSANGNNGLADAALLTPEHLRVGLMGYSQEDFDAFYTESAEASPPENWLTLYAVHDFRLLPDGRVAVNPDVIVPGVGRFIDTLIMKNVDGKWLIDFSLDGAGNIYGTDVPAI